MAEARIAAKARISVASLVSFQPIQCRPGDNLSKNGTRPRTPEIIHSCKITAKNQQVVAESALNFR
jgi:hypothetical protein